MILIDDFSLGTLEVTQAFLISLNLIQLMLFFFLSRNPILCHLSTLLNFFLKN